MGESPTMAPRHAALLVATMAVAAVSAKKTILKWNGSPKLNGEKITGPRSHQRLRVGDLPSDWDWRNVNGTGLNLLTESRNQHIPEYCGSCWAFGTLSSLNDRLKIACNGKDQETILAPQVLINCGGGGSCEGGSVGGVFQYMEENGLPDETCQNYEATDDFKSQPTGVCETCAPGPSGPGSPGNCTKITNQAMYTLESYGYVLSGGEDVAHDAAGVRVSTADKLKAEIFTNGPLACGIHATPQLDAYGTTTPVDSYPGGIYKQDVLFPMPNHILSIVGWGHDSSVNEDYWILRNSWGTYWGTDGYAKIAMGGHNLGVEHSCSWATPVKRRSGFSESAPSPSVTQRQGKTYFTDDRTTPGTFFDYKNEPRAQNPSTTSETRVVSPLPRYEDAPASFDIRNIDGRNFASPDRNQHIPQYCGSRWAHGPTSALNDRFALARKNAFPHVFLAPQQLVNCMPPPADKTQGNGGCLGGDPSEVAPFLAKTGGVHETCQNYQAKNLYPDFKCDAIGVCRNCDPSKGCFPMGSPAGQNNFTRSYPDEYGRINSTDYGANAKQMKAEIGARGPIACAVCVTPEFEQYTGGIFEDTTGCTTLDHEISIAGYGTDPETGKDYWVGRNSWGATGASRAGSASPEAPIILGWRRTAYGQHLSCELLMPYCSIFNRNSYRYKYEVRECKW